MSSRAEDLTGQKFGHLTVLYRTENRYGRTCWQCRCDCGKEKAVTENALTQGTTLSCGCLKRENQKEIAGRLHRIDGTCVEILEKRKHRKDNTSGFCGVFKMKNGKYRVSIGFKGKRFYLGTYVDFADAIEARQLAEEKIHNGFLNAYYEWKQKADQEPEWSRKHPLVFEVEKSGKEIKVRSSF